MAPGRSKSARSDMSDSDDNEAYGEKEDELKKLQRQYRIMNNDRDAYTQESQDLIRKQREELKVLNAEQAEILKNLRLVESHNNQVKDDQNTEKLSGLIETKTTVEEEIEEEQKKQEELASEIRNWEKKNKEQSKKMGGVHMSAQHNVQTTKNVRKLEGQLQQANNKFSKKLETNKKLREELDSLRVERTRFDNLYKKLEKEIQQLKNENGEVIDQSTQAYDARDEAQAKMLILKEKSDKDKQAHNAEMKELLRTIEHDRKLREFMGIKGKQLSDDPKQVEWRQKTEAREAERKKANRTDSVESYEEAYRRIKEITGEEDMNIIVEKFIEVEDRNFALFNYVNEQNNQIELLQEQIQEIKDEMDQFQRQGVELEAQRQQILRGLEECQTHSSKQADEYDEKHKGVMKILDQLRAGIESLFNKINCDKSTIDDMLGTKEGVTDQNMIQYLGVIEERTNLLLLVQQYLLSQKDEDYPRQPSLLGEGPAQLTMQPTNIAPPAVGDDYDSGASDEDESRPFTTQELLQKVMNTVKKKEAAAKKEGFRYDLSEATNKGNKNKKGKK